MTTIGLFAKLPVPGSTKSRLAASLGDETAARLSEAFTLDLLQRLATLEHRVVVCATPATEDSQRYFERCLPENAELLFQPSGDLGKRIDWFFDSVPADASEKGILLGSDAPDLPSAMIDHAFHCLAHQDLVFCPSTDGGYALVGVRKYRSSFFQNIPYSSSLTLNETLDKARSHSLTVQLTNPWYDIDTVQDLTLLRSRLVEDSEARQQCPRTLELLSQLWPQVRTVLRQQEGG